MNDTLYGLMNWADVEEIVYSESENPHAILGPHLTEEGLLIQAFLPGAKSAEVIPEGAAAPVPMEEEDENGFFACLLQEKEVIPYRIHAVRKDGREETFGDPYAFAPTLDEEELKKYAAGNDPEVYRNMGAHHAVIDGTAGVCFTVWAPNAMRVSVVGSFNDWDGRCHQMRKLGDAGVFQLFIPGIRPGTEYKFEIKSKDRKLYLKADPFAFRAQLRPGTASVVDGMEAFQWTDTEWMKARESGGRNKARPFSVYELHAGAWRGSGNWRNLAVPLAQYAKEMGYTHVELMPVMEHPLDKSLGYQSTGYFAPTARYGTPEDFRWFVNELHMRGIGLILDWPCARFPKDSFGLAYFDGTPLYEYGNSGGDTAVFNYDRPEVRDFLISNAVFWAEEYHADGLRAVDIAAVLYYGSAGQDRRNMYGGGENLEGAAFLRSLTSAMARRCPGVLMIADGSAEWPKTTEDPSEDGLGFCYRRNIGWTSSVTAFLRTPDAQRSARYWDLTDPMLYQYSESFILPLSYAAVSEGRPALVDLMPEGSGEEKTALLRTLFGFFMTHPGKKLVFSGQEFGMKGQWDVEQGVRWDQLEDPLQKKLQKYNQDLNAFYLSHPALWAKDDEPEGFEWINFHSWTEKVIVFLRKSGNEAEDLLVVLNFSQTSYPEFNIGVPFRGTFRELFNSDSKEYGGTDMRNSRVLTSRKLDVDERNNGVTVKLPAASILIFSCRRRVEKAAIQETEPAQAEQRPAVKRSAAKKAAPQPAEISPAETVAAAKEQVVKAASAAKKRAGEVASAGKKRAGEVASAGKKRAGEVASAGKKRAGQVASKAVSAASAAAQSAVDKVGKIRTKDEG